MYWFDKEYKDDRGAIVIRRDTFYPADQGSGCELKQRFYGKGMTIINSPMGEIPQEFEVEFAADSISQAFAVFEYEMADKAPAAAQEAAEAVMAQIKEKMQEQQGKIITPDQIKATGFNPNVRGS